MKFTSSAWSLRNALSVAATATPARPSLPAYGGCVLMLKGGRLTVIGADGELTIATRLAVRGSVDGQALITPKPVLGFLAAVNSDDETTVEVDNGEVQFRVQGLSPYRFRTVTGTFPLPPTTKAKPTPVDFSNLAEAVAAVRASVSPEHDGVEIVSTDEALSLRATDNYRLHAVEVPGAGFGEFSGVLRVDVLDRLAKHAVDGVSFDTKGRTLRFSGPDVIISSRLLSVPFPPVDSYLAMEQPVKVSIGVSEFKARLARLATVGDTAPVLCEVNGTTLTLKVTNPDCGSGAETMTLKEPVTEAVTFYADRQYLAEAFAAHDAEYVEMSYAQSLQPVVLRSSAASHVTTLLQPVRL